MDKVTKTIHTEQHNVAAGNCLILQWSFRGYDLYITSYNPPSTNSINTDKEKQCETQSSGGPAYFPLSDRLKCMSRPASPTAVTFFSLTVLFTT